MKIIIGLGNPGDKYANTRHNVGFMMVEKIKQNYDFPDFEFNKKFNGEISKGVISGKEILLAKPRTFMNNSGSSVHAIMDFYKIDPDDIVVIHDDLDLPLGRYKVANSSGSAGHNGVEDIISKIGTKNFSRIRIGIATENLRTKIEPVDFVLQEFSPEELKIIMGEVGESVLLEVKK